MRRSYLWATRRLCYGAARLLGDLQAIHRGRIIQRLGWRLAYRLFGRVFR